MHLLLHACHATGPPGQGIVNPPWKRMTGLAVLLRTDVIASLLLLLLLLLLLPLLLLLLLLLPPLLLPLLPLLPLLLLLLH